MEYVHYIDSGGELRHWGIKGQKWGVRRYQNKDGSLTPAGRKRYGDKFEGSSDAPKKKSVADMSDDEIRTAIARKQLENQYKQLHPEPAKKEGFASKFVNEAVKPALVNSGRKALEGFMDKTVKNLLGDKIDPDSYEALKKTYDKLDIKAKIKKLQDGEDPADAEIAALKKKLDKLDTEAKIKKHEDGEDPDTTEIASLKRQKERLELERAIRKLEKGDDPDDDSVDYDELLETYRNTPEEIRNEVSKASSYQEQLNKLRKKKSD